MKVGPLDVTFHRTVRVKEGRTPANLPPSLGHFPIFQVADHKDRCPESWDENGIFIPIQDTEAMWMSFHTREPLAVMVGAGGINAVNGEKLGTKLEKGGYCVCPLQPWLDGFKSDDGTVYQFVSAKYEGGKGLTVGEQILGEESKSGGLGIAVFEAKNPRSLEALTPPSQFYGMSSAGGQSVTYSSMMPGAAGPEPAMRGFHEPMQEMGLGKGGAIVQKIYEDPYGIEVWKETPTAAVAIYLISAEQFAQITGQPLPKVADLEGYEGKWWGLKDEEIADSPGTSVFTGLKSVFAGDTSNVSPKEEV